MSDTIPMNALIVVADGAGGTTYRNRAGDGSVKLEHTSDLGPKDLEDDGPAGSRPKDSSPRETDEATFAKQLAEWLYREAQRGTYDHLVLAADPQTLGQIRPSLHQEVTKRMVKEVGKTLTNSPIPDIERSIAAG